ncbi:hypothetical protein FHU30_006865 [Actinomadura rupiterrae]|nr:hypothetical protein [Actinomadura rupiterrae]
MGGTRPGFRPPAPTPHKAAWAPARLQTPAEPARLQAPASRPPAQEAWETVDMLKSGTRTAGIAERWK